MTTTHNPQNTFSTRDDCFKVIEFVSVHRHKSDLLKSFPDIIKV